RKKLDYCKKNWINIVIIILPLVGFLRSLRLFRMLRLAKAGKLARAYRLRGLLMRAQRLALLFNLIERILHRNPEKYLATLREREQNKLNELAEIQTKIRELEQLIAERK
ncbi:MAG: potassium channel protein - like protein, partial [Candidatus Competibacteraceae bacterium]|nr:potassium channel protein - like protein [Candidatus Competibacteraceae bacterium]